MPDTNIERKQERLVEQMQGHVNDMQVVLDRSSIGSSCMDDLKEDIGLLLKRIHLFEALQDGEVE